MDVDWFQYSIEQTLGQSADFPTGLKIWLNWLQLTHVIAPVVLAFWYREVRVLLAWEVGNLILGYVIASTWGPVRLLSLGHLLFWTPQLWLCIRWLRQGSKGRLLTIFLAVFAATTAVSLSIDVVEIVRWVAGERDFLHPWSP